jgi:hypothetical protein
MQVECHSIQDTWDQKSFGFGTYFGFCNICIDVDTKIDGGMDK